MREATRAQCELVNTPAVSRAHLQPVRPVGRVPGLG